MRVQLLLFFLATVLISCDKEDMPLRVKLSTYCKGCAVEYYDGNGALHRDTMLGIIHYTWMDGDPIVDTVAGWTAGWHVLLLEDDEPRISACSLDQDSATITLKAEGDIPTRIITTVDGCAYMP